MKKRTPEQRVRITIDANLVTGDYDITYNNVSHPGQPLDFTRLVAFTKQVLSQQERTVNDDADTGSSGQAERDPEGFH